MIRTTPRPNAVLSISSETDETWIDGQLFRITRLPSTDYESVTNNGYKLPKDLNALVKRISRLDDEKAKVAVEKNLRAAKIKALREETGTQLKRQTLQTDYPEVLEVSSLEVTKELSRLRELESRLY